MNAIASAMPTAGGFAGVCLPIGVRGKRSGGVEGEMLRRDCCEVLRVEGQHALDALNQIKQEHRYQAEQQHGSGIFGPGHFVLLVHACYSIEQSLDRA